MAGAFVTSCVITILLVHPSPPHGAARPAPAQLPAGFAPHIHTEAGGRIDWTSGELIVRGIGRVQGSRTRDRQAAQRAAEIVAARNALALALNVPIDRDGRFRDLRDGDVRVQGALRGQRTTAVRWLPPDQPTQCEVELRAPLWGARGIAAIVARDRRRRAIRAGHPVATVPDSEPTDDPAVIVIDARGTGLKPCLFPMIRQEDGAVLCDAATAVGAATAANAGAVRPTTVYVETVLSFDEIVVAIGAKREYSEAASRPVAQTRRWRPVGAAQAVKSASPHTGDIVLSTHDADRLRSDPATAELIRTGRVLIAVDSAEHFQRE